MRAKRLTAIAVLVCAGIGIAPGWAAATSGAANTECTSGRLCQSFNWKTPGSTGTTSTNGYRVYYTRGDTVVFQYGSAEWSNAHLLGGNDKTVQGSVNAFRNRDFDHRNACYYGTAPEGFYLVVTNTYAHVGWANVGSGSASAIVGVRAC